MVRTASILGGLAALLLSASCGTPPPVSAPPQDGGISPDLDAGPEPRSDDEWQWIPIAGSQCGAGATAGIGVNLAESDDLFIFMQGGGACWNAGTCYPSHLGHGPYCNYDPFCPLDVPGGQQPLSSWVKHPDPFPADGGGVFPQELAQLTNSRALSRSDPTNPFRYATWVFVPYCTGDLHSGDSTRDFAYSFDLLAPSKTFTMHFKGASNMARYLEWLKSARPNVKRIWLTGASAGGYGATLNYERVRAAFPEAEVHLLADSSPFVDAPLHWAEWRDTWNAQLPASCTDCFDGGFPAIQDYLLASYPESRMGLLAFERDRVIAYFMYADKGAAAALSPPIDLYASKLNALLSRYDGVSHAQYFVLPGEEHVMWGGYGAVLPDGGYGPPKPSADGGSDLKTWVDAWATGAPGWESLR